MADLYQGVPLLFYRDIQTPHPQVVPLIHIDTKSDHGIVRLSTVPLLVSDSVKPYYPILLDLPGITESFDFIDSKFKTSSFNFSISGLSNYIDDFYGSFLASLEGKQVTLYFKSQSVKLDSPDYDEATALDNCYKAFQGMIVDVKIAKDMVSIEVEDETDLLMGTTDIPFRDNHITQGNELIPLGMNQKEDEGSSLPYVFGYVDRSPCYQLGFTIYTGAFSTKYNNIMLDQSSFNDGSFNVNNLTIFSSPFYIYEGNGYESILYTDNYLEPSGNPEDSIAFDESTNYAEIQSFQGNMFLEGLVKTVRERKILKTGLYVGDWGTSYSAHGGGTTSGQLKIHRNTDTVYDLEPGTYSAPIIPIPLGGGGGEAGTYSEISLKRRGFNEHSSLHFQHTLEPTGKSDRYEDLILYKADISFQTFGYTASGGISPIDCWNLPWNDEGFARPWNNAGSWGITSYKDTISWLGYNLLNEDDWDVEDADPCWRQGKIHHPLEGMYGGYYDPVQEFWFTYDYSWILNHDSLTIEDPPGEYWMDFNRFHVIQDETQSSKIYDPATSEMYFGFFAQTTETMSWFSEASGGGSGSVLDGDHDIALKLHGIRVIQKQEYQKNVQDLEFYVDRFGYDMEHSTPAHIFDFLTRNELGIEITTSDRYSLNHCMNVYTADWWYHDSGDSQIYNIFGNQIDSHPIPIAERGFASYGFALNEVTNIKDFFEDFSRETNIFPSISKGKLRCIIIEDYYNEDDFEGISKLIESNDVISYSYSKTKAKDVVNRLTVKYKKNYANNDYQWQLNTVDANQIFNGEQLEGIEGADEDIATSTIYDMDYYGIREKTLKLDFIREGSTAARFAYYYLANYCNQHLIIKMDLPIKYIHLEIGDIINFDELLGEDRISPFDINYTKDFDAYGNFENRVNGQPLWSKFIVTKATKSLEKIYIECTQLHHLTKGTLTYGCKDMPGDWVWYQDPNDLDISGEFRVIGEESMLAGVLEDWDANVDINIGCNGHVIGCADNSDNIDPNSYNFTVGGNYFMNDQGVPLTLDGSSEFCVQIEEEPQVIWSLDQFDFKITNDFSSYIHVQNGKNIGYVNSSDDNNLIWKKSHHSAPDRTISILPYLKMSNLVTGEILDVTGFAGDTINFEALGVGNDNYTISIFGGKIHIGTLYTQGGYIYAFLDAETGGHTSSDTETNNLLYMLNSMIGVDTGASGQVYLTLKKAPWVFDDNYNWIDIDDENFPYQYNPNWQTIWSPYLDANNSLKFTLSLELGTLTIVEYDHVVQSPGAIEFDVNFAFPNDMPMGNAAVSGDVNFDGFITQEDINIITNIANNSGQSYSGATIVAADIDGDGDVDDQDVALAEELLSLGTYNYTEQFVFLEDAIIYWYSEDASGGWIGTHSSGSNSYHFHYNTLYTTHPFYITIPENVSTTALRGVVYDKYMIAAYSLIHGLGGNIHLWTDNHKSQFLQSCYAPLEATYSNSFEYYVETILGASFQVEDINSSICNLFKNYNFIVTSVQFAGNTMRTIEFRMQMEKGSSYNESYFQNMATQGQFTALIGCETSDGVFKIATAPFRLYPTTQLILGDITLDPIEIEGLFGGNLLGIGGG